MSWLRDRGETRGGESERWKIGGGIRRGEVEVLFLNVEKIMRILMGAGDKG